MFRRSKEGFDCFCDHKVDGWIDSLKECVAPIDCPQDTLDRLVDHLDPIAGYRVFQKVARAMPKSRYVADKTEVIEFLVSIERYDLAAKHIGEELTGLYYLKPETRNALLTHLPRLVIRLRGKEQFRMLESAERLPWIHVIANNEDVLLECMPYIVRLSQDDRCKGFTIETTHSDHLPIHLKR